MFKGVGEAVGEGLKAGRKAEGSALGALRVGDGERGDGGTRVDVMGAGDKGALESNGNSGPSILGFRCKFMGSGLVEGFALLPFPRD